jgi:hypothetical protein
VVTFIKIRSHRRNFSNSDSVKQKNVINEAEVEKIACYTRCTRHVVELVPSHCVRRILNPLVRQYTVLCNSYNNILLQYMFLFHESAIFTTLLVYLLLLSEPVYIAPRRTPYLLFSFFILSLFSSR